MTRLGTLALTLLGLAVLLVGCGGGEDESGNAVLAVAFRLDEGTPLMAAYVGDPTEDPFELPAGRYYIEALDQDEVGVSLRAVDVEEGDGVELPASLEDAGGVVDPERAKPLVTVASFLLDVELAELTFLEVATGGFTELPFDPAVEFGPTAFIEVTQMYGDIGEEGDAVLEAIADIEGRAQASLNASYVRSSWAAAPGDFDEIKQGAREFVDLTLGVRDHQRQRILEFARSIPPSARGTAFDRLPADLRLAGDREASSFDEWLDFIEQGSLDRRLAHIDAYLDGFAEAGGLTMVMIARDVQDLENVINAFAASGPFRTAVHTYAEGFVRRLGADPATFVEMERVWLRHANSLVARQVDQPRARIEETIRRYVERLVPDNPSLRDRVVSRCLDRLAYDVPQLAGTPTAVQAVAPTPTPAAPQPTATPPAAQATATPDTSWIEGFVERVGERMIDEGYSEGLAAVVMVELTECLTAAVLGGQSMEDAVTSCAQTFEGEPTPQVTATAVPEATEARPPEAHGVTAVGTFVLAMGPECTVGENTMSLTFNTGGGPGSATGQGHWRDSCRRYPECPPNVWLVSYQLRGAYDPGSHGFTGTADMNAEGVQYTPPSDPEAECHETTATGGPGYTGIPWRATLQDGSLRGEILLSEATGDPTHVIHFELTVQE